DPFAFSSFGISTRYWTVFERNNSVLPLSGVFLWNRLLWAAIGIAIFAFTLWKFRFEVGSKRKRSKRVEEPEAEVAVTSSAPAAQPALRTTGAQPAWFAQFLSTTRLELRSILKSVPFIIILTLGVVNTIANASFADRLFDTTVYPVTEVMVNAIEGGFLLFAFIIMTFYAGEIVWRERQAKLSEVVDATPVPSSAIWSGKLAALYVIVFLLMTTAILTTIGVQTAKGFHHYELALYGKRLLLETMLPMLMIATLAFVLQVLTNNKYIGFLAMLLYFVSLVVMPAMNFEHNLYRFASTPNTPYSDMNGYGHFVRPLVWFDLYWAIFCALLVVAANLLWVRGTENAFRKRLSIAGQRFGRPAIATAVALLVAFISTGCYIYYNTNVLNHYRTTEDGEKRQADGEKKFKRYEFLPQPKITDAQANVDIYPERRAVTIRGSYTMVNKTNAPLTELHVTMNPDTESKITIPTATVKSADKDFGYTIYKLDPPMQPGAMLPMQYTINITNRGFVNGVSNTDVVENGTFLNNFSYFPHLGYSGFAELQDRNKRKKYGLAPINRLPKIDDKRARNFNELSTESDFLNLDTTVSTSPDQIAIAPGYLQKEWTENGRRYFHYKTTSPILGFWSYLSARYEVKRDKWTRPGCSGGADPCDVAIEIYFDPKHPYNVDRMIYGVKKSLDYYSANFSPYQHRQVRIIEFPRYARFAQSFPNTIPFSESIGFIADLRDKNAIDYVFYVTAHEVGHQWWAHQVIGANVQGTTMITETLAQYSALMVMEHEYGRDLMHRFLKHELNRYLQGRGSELVAEMPLELVENQAYIHYGKGSLAMYELKDAIGEQNVDAALRKTIGGWAFQGPPYVRTIELLQNFSDVTAPQSKSVINDLFLTITLYDNKVTEVTSTKMADGKYRVKFTVESKKMRAEGSGNEKPVAIDDWIDVGVLAAGPTRKS
ncbi:MAG: M1 family aminopeptidase, partial [Thermoanaerobaculia bacterium]